MNVSSQLVLHPNPAFYAHLRRLGWLAVGLLALVLVPIAVLVLLGDGAPAERALIAALCAAPLAGVALLVARFWHDHLVSVGPEGFTYASGKSLDWEGFRRVEYRVQHSATGKALYRVDFVCDHRRHLLVPASVLDPEAALAWIDALPAEKRETS
ncbi:MAG: hypothetical protein AB1938_03910 [Myxococcota bacterium]